MQQNFVPPWNHLHQPRVGRQKKERNISSITQKYGHTLQKLDRKNALASLQSNKKYKCYMNKSIKHNKSIRSNCRKISMAG